MKVPKKKKAKGYLEGGAVRQGEYRNDPESDKNVKMDNSFKNKSKALGLYLADNALTTVTSGLGSGIISQDEYSNSNLGKNLGKNQAVKESFDAPSIINKLVGKVTGNGNTGGQGNNKEQQELFDKVKPYAEAGSKIGEAWTAGAFTGGATGGGAGSAASTGGKATGMLGKMGGFGKMLGSLGKATGTINQSGNVDVGKVSGLYNQSVNGEQPQQSGSNWIDKVKMYSQLANLFNRNNNPSSQEVTPVTQDNQQVKSFDSSTLPIQQRNEYDNLATPEAKKAWLEMNVQSRAEGGKIVGEGTSKSDSISGMMRKDSWVIPAENAAIAEELRAKYLGKPNKIASLTKGKEPVKVSNGEHVFTPEEVKILQSKGINFNVLSPNAEGGNTLKKGGEVGDDKEKKKENNIEELKKEAKNNTNSIQEDLDAANKLYKWAEKNLDFNYVEEYRHNYNKLVEKLNKQKKYTSELESADKAGFKDLQKITVDNTGLGSDFSDDYKKELQQAKENRSAQEIFDKEFKPSKLDLSKQEDEEYKKDATKSKIKSLGKSPSSTKDKSNSVVNDNGDVIGSDGYDFQQTAEKKQTGPRVEQSDSVFDTKEFGTGITKDFGVNHPNLTSEQINAERAALNDNGINAGEPSLTSSKDNTKKKTNSNGESILDKVGGIEGLIGAGQFGKGVTELLNDGARPKDALDSDFMTAFEQAKADARYGFGTANTQKINQDIETNRLMDNAAILNASGGNAGTALTNMRAAINSANRAHVDAAAQDETLRMNKQARVAGLASQKAGMARQLFEDDLNAFNVNQMAGADLVGAGLENLVESQRLRRNKQAMNDTNNFYNKQTSPGFDNSYEKFMMSHPDNKIGRDEWNRKMGL